MIKLNVQRTLLRGWLPSRTVMGIYDRDYYRREGPSFLGSITERGQVCKWLIIINAVVFVLQLMTLQRLPGAIIEGEVTNRLWLDPDLVLRGGDWLLL